MISCDVFAKYLLQKGNRSKISISNLKLQKLIYYCQGYSLGLHGKPLFIEQIKAWEHGPVVPSIYHEYKPYGDNPININFNPNYINELSELSVKLIDFVLMKLGGLSAWALRNQSHQETPWLSHYNTTLNKADGKEITHKELTSFFSMEISNLQDTSFAKVLNLVQDEYLTLPENINNEDQFYEWIQGL